MTGSDDFNRVLARAEPVADGAAVEEALDAMAAAITRDLAGADPLVLAVMIGGLVPAAWLLRRLDFPLQLDYIHASRYRGSTRGSERIDWIARPRASLEGRSVLVVDDILDEGHTLAAILAYCREQGAAAVRCAVLVEKLHGRRPAGLQADYTGLRTVDRYLFGCGMDYHEHHRQYAAIYALGPEDEQE